MQKHEELHKNKKEIFVNNFIGGIAWALGATVGLAIIIAILGLVLKNVDLIPFVGNFVAQVIEFIINKNLNVAR
ncbi:MAG: hypothetical protein COU25_02040 [Candidatus Levybacteria bacterium CG10_big_fil_rev_8_21_14_0_10_35_13]|nr:MAG: hypothetical protein COU25_02040 [Candidatus Levybacteria bacterium CG10_big_fil_rev_8_21_14_0_10_35_13]